MPAYYPFSVIIFSANIETFFFLLHFDASYDFKDNGIKTRFEYLVRSIQRIKRKEEIYFNQYRAMTTDAEHASDYNLSKLT